MNNTDNAIRIKISIENKEAIASLQLTDYNIQQLYKSFKYGQQVVNGFETSIARGFDNARQIIQGFRETYSALESILATPVQAAIDLEQTQVSFEVLLGSGEKAKQMLNDLREFAAKTPLQLSGLKENANLLLSFGVDAQNVLPYLKMLGDISGGNAQKLNQLTLAFAQMQSSGRLMGQDLMQMINAGFNPLQVIAEKTGKSIGELKKEMESGAISSEMIIEAFKDATSEGGKFYGMLEKQSETLGGKLSTLQDNFQQLQQQIGGAIAIGLSPLIDNFSKSITIINDFSPALNGVIGSLGVLATASFALKTTGLLPLIGNLQGVTSIAERFKLQMALAPAGIGLFQKSIAGLQITLKGLAASIGPAGWLIIGITTLTTIIPLFSKTTNDLSDNIKSLDTSLETEKEKISSLTKVLTDNNKSLNEKKNALREIQEINPDYLKGINLEKIKREDLIKSINEENKKLEQNIKIKLVNAQIEELIQKKIELQKEAKEAPSFWDYMISGLTRAQLTAEQIKNSRLVNDLIEIETKLKKLNEEKSKLLSPEDNVTTKNKNNDNNDNNNNKENIFTLKLKQLSEAQRHEAELLKIQDASEVEQIQLKKKHLEEQLTLYKKYGQDVTELLNRLTEEELRIDKLKEKREDKKYDLSTVEMKGVEMKGVEIKKPKWGDTDQYRRKSEYEEIEIWAEKEREKVAIYANADMLRAEIDAEALRRKEEVAEREKEIEEAKEKAKTEAQIETLNYVAAAGNKYTVMSKAVAVFEAYLKAKEAILTALAAFPPPFNYIAAAAVGAVTVGHIGEIIAMEPPKLEGFAEGGRLRKGEAGIVEGWHNEIIAPEKTFVEVFKQELRPQIYRMEGGVRGYNVEVTEEIRKLRSELVNGAIKAVAYLDDEQAKKLYIKGSGYMRKVIF